MTETVLLPAGARGSGTRTSRMPRTVPAAGSGTTRYRGRNTWTGPTTGNPSGAVAEPPERSRKRIDHVAKPADLGPRLAFRGEHRDAQGHRAHRTGRSNRRTARCNTN